MQNKDLHKDKRINESSNDVVRLLPDVPTGQDAFGPHNRLANSIAGIIESEVGGKAIAIEGGWGSGKSSVVEMLKERLAKGTSAVAKTYVYVFDAWSHEGDPLRRVFLEELTSFCDSTFDAETKSAWTKRQKTEITGRTKETNQRTVPILQSPWPLLALVLLTVFPIALASLGGLVRQDLKNTAVVWLIGVSAVAALVVPASLFLLFLYCVWPFWPFSICSCLSSKIGKEKKREYAGRWISLYAKKVDETTIESDVVNGKYLDFV